MFRSWVYNILFCLLLLVLMRGCAPTNQRSNSKGLVPLAPMPSEPTLEVAVLPMKEWVRRKPLDTTNKNKQMRISI
jgi:hypothetical protein